MKDATPTTPPDSPTLPPLTAIELPSDGAPRAATFYLAAEEYVAGRLPLGAYFFTWVVGPTIVVGRNQCLEDEVDTAYCHTHGIDMVRRKSGGGSIYADEGNVMTSVVVGSGAVEPLFAAYAESVAAALRRIGAPAEVVGRNDIVLTGRGKVCGNAFYHLANRNILHGTMLYDTHSQHMSRVLTPRQEKLRHSGVRSVPSRIALLRDVLATDVPTLRRRLVEELCGDTCHLGADDCAAIRRIEAGYRRTEWLHKPFPMQAMRRSGYVPQCGWLDLRIVPTTDGHIEAVHVAGDFFEQGDAQAAMTAALAGCPLTPRAIGDALCHHHPETSIRGLDAEALRSLLVGTTSEHTFTNTQL